MDKSRLALFAAASAGVRAAAITVVGQLESAKLQLVKFQIKLESAGKPLESN